MAKTYASGFVQQRYGQESLSRTDVADILLAELGISSMMSTFKKDTGAVEMHFSEPDIDAACERIAAVFPGAEIVSRVVRKQGDGVVIQILLPVDRICYHDGQVIIDAELESQRQKHEAKEARAEAKRQRDDELARKRELAGSRKAEREASRRAAATEKAAAAASTLRSSAKRSRLVPAA